MVKYLQLISGLAVLGCAVAISWVATGLVRRWALRVGFVDRPNVQKFHEGATPYGGGIAIFVAFWGTLGLGLLGGWVLLKLDPSWLGQTQASWLRGIALRLPQLGAILGGGVVLLALGLIDDRKGLGPLPKLAVEILVAVGVAACGVRATLFVESQLYGYVVTVGWIIVVINAINLLDNMDGLSAGVAACATTIFLLVAVQSGQVFITAALLALLGALLGYLRYNFPPASIFMGDAGSISIGYLLSTLTIVATYYQKGQVYAVILPLLVLAVPLFDTTSVVLLRIRLGKPIYVGDTNHFSHRLVRMGMSVRRAVLTMYLLTFCSGLGAVLLYQVTELGALLILTQTVLILVLVGLLEHESRTGRERTNGADEQAGQEEEAQAPGEAPEADPGTSA